MTTKEILLVKNTWKLFRDVNPQVVGDAFYSKLFADNRSLRKLFPTDMETQYRRLVDILNNIVLHLDDLQVITTDLDALAARHQQWGLKPSHYGFIGRALLWTLEQGLGRDWNEEVKNAWQHCYNMLSERITRYAENYTSVR